MCRYGRNYNAYFNAQYSADSNSHYNAEYNHNDITEYNALSVSMYIPENPLMLVPDSDLAIASHTTMMTMDNHKSIFRTKLYEIGCWPSNNFQKRGMTVMVSQTIPTTNNDHPGSAGMKHNKIHSPVKNASSGKCTWA
jgi:hypothetical protein